MVNTNEISWKNLFIFRRYFRKTFIQQLPNQTIRPSFRLSRPKLNSNNVPFQFIALAPFKTQHLRSLSLPCHCCKRPLHNFIARVSLVPEAGPTLIRLVLRVPLINSRKLFTMPLRLHHHHLSWLIQQVHSNNRRYGHEFLTQAKNINLWQYRTVASLTFWLVFAPTHLIDWFWSSLQKELSLTAFWFYACLAFAAALL